LQLFAHFVPLTLLLYLLLQLLYLLALLICQSQKREKVKRFVRTFQLFFFEAEQYFFSCCLQRYIDASSIMMQMPWM
jgi:hypothetical protein